MFRRKKGRKFFYLLFLFCLFFLINRYIISFSDIYRYSYCTIVYPVFLSQKYIVEPVKTFFEKRRNKQQLEDLVLSLQKDKKKLVSENISLQARVSFSDQIQEALDFKKRYAFNKSQLCQIIFKHINKNSHFIFVNKGSSHGIKKDMIALYNNILLGRVTQVFPYYSKVILTTDKSCKVAAYCAKTKANGIHLGQNLDSETLLSRVNHFEPVNNGDMVLSSGYGLVFPQGFALGKIAHFITGDLYHEIKVEPLYNIKDIEYCLLIEKGNY